MNFQGSFVYSPTDHQTNTLLNHVTCNAMQCNNSCNRFSIAGQAGIIYSYSDIENRKLGTTVSAVKCGVVRVPVSSWFCVVFIWI